jgi:hypothetical protein
MKTLKTIYNPHSQNEALEQLLQNCLVGQFTIGDYIEISYDEEAAKLALAGEEIPGDEIIIEALLQ